MNAEDDKEYAALDDLHYDDSVHDSNRKKFCLSCGATHYKEICPFCDSDAQDDL